MAKTDGETLEQLVKRGNDASSKAYKHGIVVSIKEAEKLERIKEEMDLMLGFTPKRKD